MGLNSVFLLSSAPDFLLPFLYFKNNISSLDFSSLLPRPGCSCGERESCFAAELQASQGNFSPSTHSPLFLSRLGKPWCLRFFSSVRTESRKSRTQQERARTRQVQAGLTLRGGWPGCPEGGCGQADGCCQPRAAGLRQAPCPTLPCGSAPGSSKRYPAVSPQVKWKISGLV